MTRWGSVKPKCPQGHIKAKVGMDAKGRCLVCKAAQTNAHKKARQAARPDYEGNQRSMPGLKEVRERLGFRSCQSFAVAGGFHPSAIQRIENAQARPGQARQKQIESFVSSMGGDVTRLYGPQEMVWRNCPLSIEGHAAWYSVAILDCPKCTKMRTDPTEEELSARIKEDEARSKDYWRHYSVKFDPKPKPEESYEEEEMYA